MSKFQTLSQGGTLQEQKGAHNPLVPQTRIFYVNAGEKRTVVPLDDDLIPVRRHRVWMKNPPNVEVYSYRLTCACASPFQYSEIEPRLCRGCNGIAMGYKTISIKALYYFTAIAEGELMRKDKRTGHYVPTGIWDYKYLIELDEKGRQRWEELKATYGGHLVGQRIQMFRSAPPIDPRTGKPGKAKTPQTGDAWTVLPGGLAPTVTDQDRFLWLRNHFWRSPAIPRIIEYAQRSGATQLDHETAVRDLITKANYDEELDNYSDSAANRLVAVAAGKMVEPEAAAPAGPGGGGYAAPPMPGGGQPPAPGYGAPAPAGYAGQTMAPGQVPAYPQPTAPQAGPPTAPLMAAPPMAAPPMAAPPWSVPPGAPAAPPMAAPPVTAAGYQLPAPAPAQAPAQPAPAAYPGQTVTTTGQVMAPQAPPPVPDPSAGMPAPAAPPYQAPPMPGQPPQTAAPNHVPPQAPTQATAPTTAPPPAGAGYNFDQGWSPGFPPPAGAQPAVAPPPPAAAPTPQAAPPMPAAPGFTVPAKAPF